MCVANYTDECWNMLDDVSQKKNFSFEIRFLVWFPASSVLDSGVFFILFNNLRNVFCCIIMPNMSLLCMTVIFDGRFICRRPLWITASASF